MDKYRPHIAFGIIMLIYFLIRWIRVDLENAFISYYFTDLLFVPAMCTFALIFTRMIKRNPSWIVPLHFVLIQTALISIYFEWYLPTYYGRPGWYTSDFADVIMYFLGAVIFVVIQRVFFRTQPGNPVV